MFKKYFIAGMLFWVPLVVTVFIIQFVLDLFDKMVGSLPQSMQLSNFIGFDIPGSGFLLVLLVVWLSGILVANFMGRKLMKVGDRIVQKIPLVRTIYQGVKQGLEMMVMPNSDASGSKGAVSQPGSWAIGLVTSFDAKNDIWTVFLPTTPNPTSGYVVAS